MTDRPAPRAPRARPGFRALRGSHAIVLAFAAAAALLAASSARAADVIQPPPQPASSEPSEDRAFVPNERPTLTLTRARGPIRIDGDLGDPGWAGAPTATNFSENWPNERAKPKVASEVWVTYDDEHLYLAFIAYDDPSRIRASLRDRDEMWSDDYFGILLDTYGDATWAYFLFANPLGVQGDSRYATNLGEDDGFDIIFHTEAKITDEGYQIEMAIPFASLRFPDRPVQSWKATFWRTRPRGSREQHTWAAIDRDEPCFLCQFGTLTGMEGVKPGGALELLPAVVASQSGSLNDGSDPSSGFANGGLEAEPSLGVRYSFAGGLTAEAAINPDFSQVESDVAQVDVNTTFALFFPERRPFFQEGSDLFNSYFDVVYTRQINDPQIASKLVGRMGRASVAYLVARDEHSPILLPFEERSFIGQAGRSVSNVLRARRTFGENSYVGTVLTDRRLEGNSGSGTVGGVDGMFRFFKHYQLEYQFLGSHTREPDDPSLTEGVNGLTFDRGRHTAAFDGESFWGFAQYTSIERHARTWFFDLDYWAYSPTFRADNGFETRNDLRRISLWNELNFFPGTKLVDHFGGGVFLRRDWNFSEGARKREIVELPVWASLTGQTHVNAWVNFGSERFRGIDFEGLRAWGLFAQTSFSDPIRIGLFVRRGRNIARFTDPPRIGSGTDLELFGTFKPMQRLVISPSLVYSELRELDGGPLIFSGYILRTRSSLQFSRELFLRLVVQYNEFAKQLSVEPLLTYKINPFTLFYVGSTMGYGDYEDPDVFAATSRQFFAKFQYLLRR